MQVGLSDEVYERLCQLAHERNLAPAPLVKMWIEAQVWRLWGERGEPDMDAVASPPPNKPRYKGRARKVC